MSLDPTNQKAQQLLDKLLAEKNLSNHHLIPEIYNFPANKKPSSINWSIIIIIGIVGIIIAAVFALTRKEPYKPNASDAFSYAAGYALKEMYARDPVNYWCTETATKKASYWYQIAVTDLGNGRFYAIGATKAMDQNCVYQTGYFAATVYYEPEDWKLDGKIYHSNSCLTIANDSGECTAWDYGWTPDMNWRPPKK
jgi:hypothetical protein